MQGSFRTEKISPSRASDNPRHDWRKADNTKPRRKGKSAYSSARKLKESQYVWSE